MLKKWIAMGLCLVSVCCFAYSWLAADAQARLAGRVVRFHILANSDSPHDQWEKLQVRDALLPEIAALTADCRTSAEAERALASGLDRLQALADGTLQKLGSNSRARVTLTDETYPRRNYATFSLPAGTYRSLRVTVGSGAGHNWWCVAFPGLCLSATVQEVDAVAADAGFSMQEQELLTGSGVDVELKFRTLEWLRALRDWFH